MKRQIKSFAQTIVGGFIGSILTLTIVLKTDCSPSAHADAPPPAYPPPSGSFPITKQLDDSTWRKHDTELNVTCWVYYWDGVRAGDSSGHGAVGGISCLPDHDVGLRP